MVADLSGGNAAAGAAQGWDSLLSVPAAIHGVELVSLWVCLGAQGKLPSEEASRNRESEKQSSWNLGILWHSVFPASGSCELWLVQALKPSLILDLVPQVFAV